jgi:quinol monooxygenase YgiN
MRVSRRTALKAAVTLPLTENVAGQQRIAMYGLIGRIKAHSGRRDELAAILLESTIDIPGCLSYVVAKDLKDPDALWVTEVWESEADHRSSLALPSVREAISRGRPLIAAFDQQYATEPIGGAGIKKGH